jgi:hypothetical protein
VNAIVVPVEGVVVVPSVTDHEVPVGRPVSVKITVNSPEASLVNATGTVVFESRTVVDPLVGDEVNPAIAPISYPYVPGASVKFTHAVVELWMEVPTWTVHWVAAVRPLSTNDSV